MKHILLVSLLLNYSTSIVGENLILSTGISSYEDIEPSIVIPIRDSHLVVSPSTKQVINRIELSEHEPDVESIKLRLADNITDSRAIISKIAKPEYEDLLIYKILTTEVLSQIDKNIAPKIEITSDLRRYIDMHLLSKTMSATHHVLTLPLSSYNPTDLKNLSRLTSQAKNILGMKKIKKIRK